MTAMITEARRVTIRGTMAENATIIAWVAENCPKAAREPSFSSDLTQVILTFEDDGEYAKFKLVHADEFNELTRRDAEYHGTNSAGRAGGHAFPGRAIVNIGQSGYISGFSFANVHPGTSFGIDPSKLGDDND